MSLDMGMLSLRCHLDIQVEVFRTQLAVGVWGSEDRPRVEIKMEEFSLFKAVTLAGATWKSIDREETHNLTPGTLQ